jgi:hypothetical protein
MGLFFQITLTNKNRTETMQQEKQKQKNPKDLPANPKEIQATRNFTPFAPDNKFQIQPHNHITQKRCTLK